MAARSAKIEDACSEVVESLRSAVHERVCIESDSDTSTSVL